MKSCLEYTLDYLSRYPKTVHELGLQLKKKGYDHDEIESTILRVQELGYVDDKVYAELYLTSEVGRKGKPLSVVRQKLYQKGVDAHLIQQVIAEQEDQRSQGVMMKIQKLAIGLQDKGYSDVEIIQKLQRRGYHISEIKTTLSSLDSAA